MRVPEARFRADPHLTGRSGGYTLSLHDFHRRGIRLLGRLVDCDGERGAVRRLRLHAEMRFADEFADRIVAEFERHIREARHRRTAADRRGTRRRPAGEDGSHAGIAVRELGLGGAGIASVVWAAGYRYDFSWIEAPVLDDAGYPVAPGGASACPGLYFTGLNWMTRRKSGILYGVGEDARSVAQHLADRRAPIRARR